MQSEQQQRIMGYFIEEAKDHLETIEKGLLNLQGTIGDPELISELFRAAHSVKGGAAMLGLDSIQQTSHRLEDYFKVLKECPVTVDQKLETLFLRVFDTLQDLLEQLQGPFGLTQEKASQMMQNVEPVFSQLHTHLNSLVEASGGLPLEAPLPAEAPSLPVDSDSTAGQPVLRAFFQTTVTAQLRSLLSVFKQEDSVDSRQQLQDICQSLLSEGQSLSAPAEWQALVSSAQKAIAYEENTYRQLAPVVIKALKHAQNLGSQNRSHEISVTSSLFNLLPPEGAQSITQDDNLDALLANASRDADQVLDTVLDDSLSLDSDLSSEDYEPSEEYELIEGVIDPLELSANDALVDNGADPVVSDAELADLLDIGESNTPSTEPADIAPEAADESEDLDVEWLQDSLAPLSENDDSGEDWLSNVSSTDTPLEDGLGLIDEIDAVPASSGLTPTTSTADASLVDDLESKSDGDQIGPQVGPDEMDTLADLFSGNSDELNLDWNNDGEDSDRADALSDDLELDNTSDFSDLLFDAANQDDPDSQDLTADDDDIATLLNTLDVDGIEEDDEALATTPLLPDESIEEGVSELLPPSLSDDEFTGNELRGDESSTSTEEAKNDAPDDDLLADVWSDVGQSTDMPLNEGDEVHEALTNDGSDHLIESVAGSEASEVSSNEFDQLFVGLESEGSIFDSPDQDDNPPPELDDNLNTESSGAFNALGMDDQDNAFFVADEASSDSDAAVEHNDLQDVWGDDDSSDSGLFQGDEFSDFNGTTPNDEAIDYLADDTTPTPTDDADERESDILDTFFGKRTSSDAPSAPSTGDEAADDIEDSVNDTSSIYEAEDPEEISDAVSSNATSNLLESMGLDESEDLFLADVEPQVASASNASEALPADALPNQLDFDESLSDGSVSDLGFDLEALGQSEGQEVNQDESSNMPVEENATFDDGMLDSLFDQGLTSDPIVIEEEPDIQAPDDLAEDDSVGLDTLFGEAFADDTSISASLDVSSDSLDILEASHELGISLDSDNSGVELEAMFDDLDLENFEGDTGLEEGLEEALETSSSLAGDIDDHDGIEIDLTIMEPSERIDALDDDTSFTELDALLDEPDDESLMGQGMAQEESLEHGLVDINPGLSGVDDFADLDALLSDTSSDADMGEDELEEDFADLEKLLEDADQSLGGPTSSSSDARPAPKPQRRPTRRGFSNQTMRVSVKNLDNLNNLVGELVVNRNSLEQSQERLRQFLDNLLYQVQQLSDVGQRMRDLYERSLLESSLLSSRRSYQSMAVSDKVASSSDVSHATGASFDALEMDRFTGFHTLSQEMIELIVRVRESASDIDFVVDESDQVTRMFRQVTTQLQEGLTRTRMVSFSQAADRLPRAVRDIAIKCGKQAKLVVEGRDTLIDKMILEQLYDPMTHLVNNAITHGIETPDARVDKNKAPVGTITIRSFHQGNQTIISVTDDGGGIDPDVVRVKAIEKGLITAQEAEEMSRLDIYDLLFHHGFSTRDKADDFAGRGVGMDVVRTSLSEIRGVVNIDSAIDQGTTFTIRLPLTLSISKALLCVSNRARIAFPMDGVEDMLDVPQDRIQMDDQRRPSIMWRDILLPFRPLSDLLKFNRRLGRGSVYGGGPEDDIISVVVLRSGGNYLALQVDQVLGEQEIVIKQLESPVPKPTGIAGATVLGDGRIMPIADVLELIDLSVGRIRRDAGSQLWEPSDDAGMADAAITTNDPTVLIVDDSITVRELLSMTFSKVGYRVEQARDGQEAWEKLRSGLPCDLVFCDIEMPRMDGLELLSRLQKDANFSQLPIAMLTSRGADRHRQMAVQLGAKGYFTKPYLEESLLDAAQRMLKGEVLVASDG